MSLLIVEDDGLVRSALARVAKRYFDEIADVDNGFSALMAVNEMPPKVLITDWDLGGDLSGVDVANYVNSYAPDCRLVFITGNSLSKLQELTTHLDVHTYLAKPFTLESIKSVLRQLGQSH